MVYVILVNYNNSKDTIECLASLMSIEDFAIAVIVVDNHSLSDQLSLLKHYISQFSKIELIENNENSGFSSGCNTALKKVLKRGGFDYIWLLNNDTVVTKLTLSSMINTIEKNTSIGVCGSKILDLNHEYKIQSIGGKLNQFFSTTSHIQNADKINELDYIVGASMLISKRCIEQVGLLSEDYFLYYEDVDYSLRVKEQGFLLAVSMDSIVYHKEGRTTIPTGKKSEFIDLLQIQNRKVFAKKFAMNRFGVYCGIFLTALNRLRRGQFSRMKKVFTLMFRDYNWKRLKETANSVIIINN